MAANLSYNPKVSFFGELKMRLKYKLLPQITPLRMCLLFCNCYNMWFKQLPYTYVRSLLDGVFLGYWLHAFLKILYWRRRRSTWFPELKWQSTWQTEAKWKIPCKPPHFASTLFPSIALFSLCNAVFPFPSTFSLSSHPFPYIVSPLASRSVSPSSLSVWQQWGSFGR